MPRGPFDDVDQLHDLVGRFDNLENRFIGLGQFADPGGIGARQDEPRAVEDSGLALMCSKRCQLLLYGGAMS